MALKLFRRLAAMLLAAAIAGFPLAPAHACMWNDAYEPDKPFDETYFSGAKVIFRGSPIGYRYPNSNLNDQTIVGNRAEITFSVAETYQGEQRDVWTVVWITTAFPTPIDLLAFKHEIGDDLVVVLEGSSNIVAIKFGDLPFVAHENCGQPGMRSYAVMEPVLRARGLIE